MRSSYPVKIAVLIPGQAGDVLPAAPAVGSCVMGAGADGVPVAGLYALLIGSAVLSGFGDILIFHWAKGQSGCGLLAGIAMWVVSLVLISRKPSLGDGWLE